MLQAIFNFLIDFFFFLIKLIVGIPLGLIQVILVTLIPAVRDFISIVNGFFNTYVWNYLSFLKELVLDVSCLPRGLWSSFVGFMVARWVAAPGIRAIKLIVNSWKITHGGDTK